MEFDANDVSVVLTMLYLQGPFLNKLLFKQQLFKRLQLKQWHYRERERSRDISKSYSNCRHLNSGTMPLFKRQQLKRWHYSLQCRHFNCHSHIIARRLDLFLWRRLNYTGIICIKLFTPTSMLYLSKTHCYAGFNNGHGSAFNPVIQLSMVGLTNSVKGKFVFGRGVFRFPR